MPNITILNGEETGKTYSWTADQIRIGRNSANDFVIANASVSGVHCIIERCESGWRVRDLDSTNGTRVNDQRVEMANVRRNDVITLGDIALSLRGDDVPESEPGVVESVGAIPRTTIVMRPATSPVGSVEGFGKKSESKKVLNVIIGVASALILVLIVIVLLKLFGVL